MLRLAGRMGAQKLQQMPLNGSRIYDTFDSPGLMIMWKCHDPSVYLTLSCSSTRALEPKLTKTGGISWFPPICRETFNGLDNLGWHNNVAILHKWVPTTMKNFNMPLVFDFFPTSSSRSDQCVHFTHFSCCLFTIWADWCREKKPTFHIPQARRSVLGQWKLSPFTLYKTLIQIQ